MAQYVFCPKGTAFKMPTPGAGKTNFYHVTGLSGKTTKNGAILVTGITDTESDVISKMLTLSEKKVLYRFTPNFGGLSIRLTIILGNLKDSDGDELSTVTEWFNKYRITSGAGPVGVSFASKDSGKIVYPVAMRHGPANAMHHTLSVEIDCVTVSKK